MKKVHRASSPQGKEFYKNVINGGFYNQKKT